MPKPKNNYLIYLGVAIGIAILACMYYPLGFSSILQSNDSSTGVCKFCCDLNHWAFEHNITADLCANVTGGGDGSGGNSTNDTPVYTCALSRDTLFSTGTCEGTCPSGQSCQATYILTTGDECSCQPDDGYTPPGATPPLYTCTDSDGGQDATRWGYCQSDYTHTGVSDECINGTYVTERYCDEIGRCASAAIHCARDDCDSPGYCV
jgi:hypothetical protein